MALPGVPAPPPLEAPGQVTTRRSERSVLDAAIERVWRHIPRVFRAGDTERGSPLRRWLGLLVDQITPIDVILDRGIDNVDPDQTDPTWLPWLGQLIGVPLDPSTTVLAQRARLRDPFRHTHGSAHAIAELVKPSLTGTQSVEVVPHWRGNRWLICVQTLEAETPLTGVSLSSWADITHVLPTWTDWELYTWDQLLTQDRVRLDIVLAASPECPAGARICHSWLTPGLWGDGEWGDGEWGG